MTYDLELMEWCKLLGLLVFYSTMAKPGPSTFRMLGTRRYTVNDVSELLFESNENFGSRQLSFDKGNHPTPTPIAWSRLTFAWPSLMLMWLSSKCWISLEEGTQWLGYDLA